MEKTKKAGRIIKKILLAILISALAVAVVAACANAVTAKLNLNYIEKEIKSVSYENQLVPKIDESTNCKTFYTDGDLKVMQLSDVHIGGGWMSYKKDRAAINCVANMVYEEKPDLIIITGDSVYPVPFQSGTFNNKTGAKIFANLMDSLGVYWAPIFGNHDTEAYAFFSRKSISEYYEAKAYLKDGKESYCLFCAGDENIDGFGNYAVNVKNSAGVITQSFFLMDTGSYVDNDYFGALWKYDGLHQNQIDWYEATLKEFEKQNQLAGASMPKSMLFIHIPMEEYKIAWDEYVNNNYQETEDVKYFHGESGEPGEDVYPSLYPDNMFETIEKLGSTQAIFCGHDHLNNFSISYKGVRLTYGFTIDYLAYTGIKDYGRQRGCTLINVKSDGGFECKQENYYQEKYENENREEVTMDYYYSEEKRLNND